MKVKNRVPVDSKPPYSSKKLNDAGTIWLFHPVPQLPKGTEEKHKNLYMYQKQPDGTLKWVLQECNPSTIAHSTSITPAGSNAVVSGSGAQHVLQALSGDADEQPRGNGASRVFPVVPRDVDERLRGLKRPRNEMDFIVKYRNETRRYF